jgi:hypothetical protein
MKNLAIVVNTHSSSKDVWPLFFGQLEKHYPNIKTYVFTDNDDGIDSKYNTIIYDGNNKFRTQYLNSIKQVEEEYIIYLNEDYVLYGDVDGNKMGEFLTILKENEEISFIRFTRGPNFTSTKFNNDLYYLTHKQDYFFSQTAALWRKKSIEMVHELGPDLHIGIGGDEHGHFESAGNKVCEDLGMIGLVYHNDEPKRGMYHYDSNIFSYIATAIIKGKWNISEYREELLPLLDEYNIDFKIRGSV